MKTKLQKLGEIQRISNIPAETASSRTAHSQNFSQLSRNEKLKKVMKDDVQWSKFRRSLVRTCGKSHVKTNAAIRAAVGNGQMIDDMIDRRIREMEQLERAVVEAEHFQEKTREEGAGETKTAFVFQEVLAKAAKRMFYHGTGVSSCATLGQNNFPVANSYSDDSHSLGSLKDMRLGKRCSQTIYGWDDSSDTSLGSVKDICSGKRCSQAMRGWVDSSDQSQKSMEGKHSGKRYSQTDHAWDDMSDPSSSSVRDMRPGKRCSQVIYGWDDSSVSDVSRESSKVTVGPFCDDTNVSVGDHCMWDRKEGTGQFLSTGRRRSSIIVGEKLMLLEAGTNPLEEDIEDLTDDEASIGEKSNEGC